MVTTMAKQKHEMTFKKSTDFTVKDEPTTIVAHRLTRKDLMRYDSETGHFRGQGIRFAYTGVVPKVGEFIVRFDEADAVGVVTLVGARRFYQITGDEAALNELGKLGEGEEEQCA